VNLIYLLLSIVLLKYFHNTSRIHVLRLVCRRMEQLGTCFVVVVLLVVVGQLELGRSMVAFPLEPLEHLVGSSLGSALVACMVVGQPLVQSIVEQEQLGLVVVVGQLAQLGFEWQPQLVVVGNHC